MAASPDRDGVDHSRLIILADTDIILKLCACNLIEEAIMSLGALPAMTRVLPTARFKIARSNKLIPRYTRAGVTRALAFVRTCASVEPGAHLADRMAGLLRPGIDEGEALLMASAADFPDSLLATGDKKSLLTLCENPMENREIRSLLAGRVICFEALLLRLIHHEQVGFERVRESVVAGLLTEQREATRDVTMAVVFSQRMKSNQVDVEDKLRSYLNHLRSQTGDLLGDFEG